MRTLLDDDEIESGQISVDDAAAHRLALALTRLQTTHSFLRITIFLLKIFVNVCVSKF